MDTTINELEQEFAEGSEPTEGTTEGAEGTEGTTENGGRKKHSRQPIFIEIDGNRVAVERIWGYALFPVQTVRDFTQFCRDTGQKSNDIIGKIIADGMGSVIAEVERTAEERAANRTVKALPSDEQSLARQEAKLLDQIARQQAQLEAVKARAAALKSAAVEVVGEDPLAAVLGTQTETAPAPAPAPTSHGRNKRSG